MSAKSATYLDLVQECDNFTYDQTKHAQYYKLLLRNDPEPHGYMIPSIVKRMPWPSSFTIDHTAQTVTCTSSTTDSLTASFATLVLTCITTNLFSCIGARHSEPYLIPGYHTPVSIERFAAPLFGITNRGAHLTAYTLTTSGGMKIWVPRRSPHLMTYPNLLDSTVAGGVAAHESPFENIMREAGEEASLSAELVRRDAKAVGCVSYVSVTDDNGRGWESGLVVPDLVYCFDMELAADMVPTPRDDEVKEFYLMSVEEVKAALRRREFKTNCAVVMIDFFIRHGILTAEEEGEYVEIVARMHRRLPFRTSPKISAV